MAVKLRKGERFLFMAGLAMDDTSPDVAISLAAISAINSSDAILLVAKGSFPSGQEHEKAASELIAAGFGQEATHLRRAIGNKHKAQYQARHCSMRDAEVAQSHAQRLLDSAKEQARKAAE